MRCQKLFSDLLVASRAEKVVFDHFKAWLLNFVNFSPEHWGLFHLFLNFDSDGFVAQGIEKKLKLFNFSLVSSIPKLQINLCSVESYLSGHIDPFFNQFQWNVFERLSWFECEYFPNFLFDSHMTGYGKAVGDLSLYSAVVMRNNLVKYCKVPVKHLQGANIFVISRFFYFNWVQRSDVNSRWICVEVYLESIDFGLHRW